MTPHDCAQRILATDGRCDSWKGHAPCPLWDATFPGRCAAWGPLPSQEASSSPSPARLRLASKWLAAHPSPSAPTLTAPFTDASIASAFTIRSQGGSCAGVPCSGCFLQKERCQEPALSSSDRTTRASDYLLRASTPGTVIANGSPATLERLRLLRAQTAPVELQGPYLAPKALEPPSFFTFVKTVESAIGSLGLPRSRSSIRASILSSLEDASRPSNP